MTSTAALRLPGLSFETVTPAVTDTLPRLDVAGFVGFAAAGPVDVPVAVEEVAGFREVFGPDAPLARDRGTGEVAHAHLGPTVEQFFAGGGRRCWVVRVADASTAVRARFPLSGLVRVGTAPGGWRLATARARAIGSWSDNWTVAPVLETTLLPSARAVDTGRQRLTLSPTARVVAGDLLRLSVDGGRSRVLVSVAAVDRTDGVLEIRWDQAVALDAFDPASTPGVVERAAIVTQEGEVVLTEVPDLAPDDETGHLVVTFPHGTSGSGARFPGVGDLLRLEGDDASTVLAVPLRDQTVPPDGTSPPAPAAGRSFRSGPVYRVTTGGAWPTAAPAALPSVELLSLSLTVWQGQQLAASIDGLGFDPRHPLFWGALPTDEELYAAEVDRVRPGGDRTDAPDRADLWRLARSPRFWLAGSENAVQAVESGPGSHGGSSWSAWVPIGMPDVRTMASAQPPFTDTAPTSRLARDGLATFGAQLFLDDDLSRLSATTVVERAHAKAFLADPPEPLRGMHALIPVEEATVMAVPDAVHPGWEETDVTPRRVPPAGPMLAAPLLHDRDAVTLWWTPVEDAAAYVVEQSPRPDLAGAVVRLDGPAPVGPASPPAPLRSILPDEAVGVRLDGFGGCRSPVYFRVAARSVDGDRTPWSNTVAAHLPDADFRTCRDLLEPPVLRLDLGSPPGHSAELSWQPRPPLHVEVEASPDPRFTAVTRSTVHDGAATTVPAPVSTVHHRARYMAADGGSRGPWSNTTVYPAPPRTSYQLLEPLAGEPAADLLAVQRTLLRLAAGRGDVLAVLPAAARQHPEDVVAHVAALTATRHVVAGAPGAAPGLSGAVPPLGAGERFALGYGAVYAPWPSVRTATGVRPVPPDGCVTGMIARRTIADGAWASPGHQPLDGVVALTPRMDDTAAQRLAAEGVNVLAREPFGFTALTAGTLSTEATVRPIGVRRLLILLRRLALRHGATYVFEPHGHRFRAMVRRTFEDLLGRLFERGALAGATAGEAFRVVADDSVNPPSTVDAGRFVVELRVAPAQPLVFLRVRLVQSGAGELTVVEG